MFPQINPFLANYCNKHQKYLFITHYRKNISGEKRDLCDQRTDFMQ